MAQDKSFIQVPPISFVNNTLISASPSTNQTFNQASTTQTFANQTNANANVNIDSGNDFERLTDIEREIVQELEGIRNIGSNAATVQSSGGGDSGPTGLGDTLD